MQFIKQTNVDSQRGALLLSAVVLVVIVGFLATIIVMISTVNSRSTANQIEQSESFYLSQSGLETAKYALFNFNVGSRVACSALGNNPGLQNIAFNTGVFSVSSSLTGPLTTVLSSSISSSDTLIPVLSTAGFSSSGRVIIEREAIDYAATSSSVSVCGTPPCLIGVKRGAGGTTPVLHYIGAQVGQYQCNLTSQGGVPVLSPTSSIRAKTTVQASESLQYGFLVGDSSSAERLYAWNISSAPNAWTQFPDSVGIPNNTNFNAVYATNFNRAWAVGSSGRIAYYNGSAWVLQLDTSGTLYGVACAADNDCFAVGSNGNVYHYNGAAWSAAHSVGNNVTLTGIDCHMDTSIASQSGYKPYFCFAVGYQNSNTGFAYYHPSSAALTSWITFNIGFQLNGVSCSSASSCMAVGGSNVNTAQVARYNGNTWAAMSIPTPNARMNAVDCVTPNDCWAVGRSGYVYHYDGNTWSGGSNIGSGAELHTVKCFNAHDCWAGADSGQLYHYNGSNWSLFADFGNFSLNGISFPTRTNNPQSFWEQQ